jgi:S-adenosylmethionine hydrolase
MAIKGLVDTFGQRPVGELIALLGSTGNLGIAVVNGNAAAKFGIKLGDEILLSSQSK